MDELEKKLQEFRDNPDMTVGEAAEGIRNAIEAPARLSNSDVRIMLAALKDDAAREAIARLRKRAG